MKPSVKYLGLLGLAGLLAAGVLAQYGNRYRMSDRAGVPEWQVDAELPKDIFTFVRIKYSSDYSSSGGRRGWGGWGGDWRTDYPDAELNLAFRLHQMTSLKVDPEGKILELTDKELFDYPFIYIVEPGRLLFSDEEVTALRRYLLNGGFLMVDDFWGEREWENFYEQIKRVFPEREPVELPMEHPIFHCVFDLKVSKNQLQIPNIGLGAASRYNGGITWERPDAKEVHYKAIYDDKDHIMAIICHNTDLGDGWEREGEDEYYFREFSEKRAYPLGINIIFYAMTH